MSDTSPADRQIQKEAVRVLARDGFSLAALWVRPEAPRAALLISTGTGFPKEYYLRFAMLAARRGMACLLYDWRGIGGSAPEDLSDFDVDYPDWGRLDFPAVIDELRRNSGTTGPHLHLGHSVGGHFVGFADNQDQLDAHAFVCVGSGYWGHHHLWYRPAVMFFWHGWGSYCLARYGYVKTGMGWTGRPVPGGVFRTWRRWCHKPRYYLAELETSLRPHHFDEVKGPIRSFVYTDDPIATPKTARLILEAYPQAEKDMVVASPSDFGLGSVTHGGPFSKKAIAAAEPVLEWLEAQESRRPSS